MNNSIVEALYREQFECLAKRFGEDAVQDAFVELLEGKLAPEALAARVKTIRSSRGRQERREVKKLLTEIGPSNSGLRAHQADYSPSLDQSYSDTVDNSQRGLAAGDQMGFPFNELGESTWS